jgi:hypothetical protein
VSEQRGVLATGVARDSTGLSLDSRAMAARAERCPACGLERAESQPCPRCAHLSTAPRKRATGAIRTKINAEAVWHSSAPSLTMEAQRWLAELAGCLWDALRTAEQTDDDR